MIAYELETIVVLARPGALLSRALCGLPENDWTLTDLPPVESKSFWDAAEAGAVLTGRMTDGTAFKSGGTTGKPKFSIYRASEWDSLCEGFAGAWQPAGYAWRAVGQSVLCRRFVRLVPVHHPLSGALRGTVVHFPLAGRVDADMLHIPSPISRWKPWRGCRPPCWGWPHPGE